jgi:ABC-type microcin C transport system duplicated ATPase subunit YejF
MHQGQTVMQGEVPSVFFKPQQDYTRRPLAAASGHDIALARS